VTLRATVGLELPVLVASRDRAPDVDLAACRWTTTSDGRRDLTAWASGGDRAAFEAGLDADPSVHRWLRLGRETDRSLYRIRLTEGASERADPVGWTDGEAVLGRACPTGAEWVLEGLFRDRSVVRRLERRSEASGVPFSLRRVRDAAEPLDCGRYGLTELQAASLRFALDRGYFDVPRETTLEELASALDVSHQALSERVRRGVGALVDTTLGDDSPEEVRERPGHGGASDVGSVLDGRLAAER
jgi:hypothetical protein